MSQVRKCPKHNLVAGPDGRCVLCRRDERTRSSSTGWLVPVLALTVVVGGAFAYYRWWSTKRNVAPVAAPTEQPRDTPPAAAPPPQDPAGARVVAPGPRAMRADAALVAVARDAGAGGARSPGAAAAPSPAQAAEAQANLLAAMRRVPITMYWAAWCPTCVKARAWTRANQLAVTERNVDTDEAAKQEIKRYNPRGSIPTIVIDGNTYVGFDKEELWDAIDKVARRELNLPAGQ